MGIVVLSKMNLVRYEINLSRLCAIDFLRKVGPVSSAVFCLKYRTKYSEKFGSHNMISQIEAKIRIMNKDDSGNSNLLLTPALSSRIVGFADTIRASRLSFLQTKDLVAGHDDFLLALGQIDGVTMGTLAESIGISASSATKFATRLEAQNLIRREPSRIDSRQNHAFLTEEGRALVGEIQLAYGQIDQSLVAKMKPKDLERCFRIFDKLESDSKSVGKKPKKAGLKKEKTKSAGSRKKKKN